jgi:hypothetical protein
MNIIAAPDEMPSFPSVPTNATKQSTLPFGEKRERESDEEQAPPTKKAKTAKKRAPPDPNAKRKRATECE